MKRKHNCKQWAFFILLLIVFVSLAWYDVVHIIEHQRRYG